MSDTGSMRMAEGAGQIGLVGTVVPVVCLLLAALIMLLPLAAHPVVVPIPHLVLIVGFYWLSHRPLHLPYGAVAAIGFFLDLWLGVPLGLNMLLLVLVRLFVLNQLKFYKGRSRLVHWWIFSVLALGLYVLSYVIVSIVRADFTNPLDFLLEWVLTSLFYVPVAYLMGRIRRMTV